MFNRKKKKLSSIEPLPDTNIVQQNISTPAGPANSSPLFFRDIHQCTLAAFITCICDEDLTALGVAPMSELQEAWFNIYTGFIEASEEPDVRLALRLTRAIYTLRYKRLKIENVVAFLAVRWDEDYVSWLRKLGYRYKFDATRAVEYSRDLKLILSRLGKYDIEIELFQAELDAIEEKNKGEKVSRAYFTKTLVRLGNHNKYRIDPSVVTVAEYCELKTAYINYIKQTEADARKR